MNLTAAAELEPHPFDLATALEPISEEAWRGTTSDAYWNMVGPFGGAVAASMFRAAYEHPGRRGEPVALTINFCAPLTKGEFVIVARPARTGRSTQHWTLELSQGDGDAVATGTALFGERPDTFSHRLVDPPRVPPFEALSRFPAPGLGWTEQYDFRFAEGAPDFGTGGTSVAPAKSLLWVQSVPARTLDFAGLTALSDIFFGRIIHVRGQMVPFGTVSMTTFFHASGDDLAAQGSRPVLGHADARIFERGFHDQSAEVWSEDGRLLATSHQIVYYRDPKDAR